MKNSLIRWISLNSIGELIGLSWAAVICVFALNTVLDLKIYDGIYFVLILIAIAGIGEGAILAYFQSLFLKEKLMGFQKRVWIKQTSIAAAVCYLIGTSPFIIFSQFDFVVEEQTSPGFLEAGLMSLIGGIFLGGIIGFFQGKVIRQYGISMKKWLLANALGWFIALCVIFMFASIPSDVTPLYQIIILAIIAGSIAGAIVAIFTWFMAFPESITNHVHQH